ncbi:MAG: cupin domain-containing protein [Pseudomonadota bacterium]
MVFERISEYTVADFMATFWQREAYLAKQALPEFQSFLGRDDILQLATREEVESRLIIRTGEASWDIEYGPFTTRRFKKLPATGWTILIQGLNHHALEADALLKRFAFIPYARLDDVMVSYAVDGGGVGPHFDSYDVFLLQGMGQRRWAISAQEDLRLVPDLPLKILQNFQAEQSWVLSAGDMLYLPPRYAHDGVAQGECITYSIGFRAPDNQEWVQGFLNYWHDQSQISGRYHDQGLKATDTPACIPGEINQHVDEVLQRMPWSKSDVARFVGCYLTEPKATVFFDAPESPMSLKRFVAQVLSNGIKLDQKTQLLYDQQWFYLNGEATAWKDVAEGLRDVVCKLANQKELKPFSLSKSPEGLEAWLYGAYCDGFLQLMMPAK